MGPRRARWGCAEPPMIYPPTGRQDHISAFGLFDTSWIEYGSQSHEILFGKAN